MAQLTITLAAADWDKILHAAQTAEAEYDSYDDATVRLAEAIIKQITTQRNRPMTTSTPGTPEIHALIGRVITDVVEKFLPLNLIKFITQDIPDYPDKLGAIFTQKLKDATGPEIYTLAIPLSDKFIQEPLPIHMPAPEDDTNDQ